MNRTVSPRAAWLGTSLVAIRGVPLILHSAAHVELAIYLPSLLANAYVLLVLYIAPIAAAGLLWTSAARAGAWLLFWSMLGSLLFEVYHHFLAMSPDHVSQVPQTWWGTVFQMTAAATAILEAIGCALGIYWLRGPLRHEAFRQRSDGNTT